MHTPWRPSGHIGDPSKMVGQLAIEPANAMREPHSPFSIPHSPLERANRQKKKQKKLSQGERAQSLVGSGWLGTVRPQHAASSERVSLMASRFCSRSHSRFPLPFPPPFDAMRCGPTQSGSQLVSWTDMRRELGTGNRELGRPRHQGQSGRRRQLRNCNRPLGRPKDQWQVYAVISRFTCCCNAC